MALGAAAAPQGRPRAHLAIAHPGQQAPQPLSCQLVWVGLRPPPLLMLVLRLSGCACCWRLRHRCCAGLACRLLLGAHNTGPAHSPASPHTKLGWTEGCSRPPRAAGFRRCQGAGSGPHGAAHSERRLERDMND